MTALTAEQIAELTRLEAEVVRINAETRAGFYDGVGLAALSRAHEDWSAGLKSAAPTLLRLAREHAEMRELFASLACITEDTNEYPFCNYSDDEGDAHDFDCPLKALLERFAKP